MSMYSPMCIVRLIECRIYQRNKREGLRKIADKTFRHGIILLG